MSNTSLQEAKETENAVMAAQQTRQALCSRSHRFRNTIVPKRYLERWS